MCQLGASKLSVLSMLETICGMRHHTRMVHGDSQCFASQSTWAQLVTSIGQGNGAGPAIWGSLLFDIMKADDFLALVICAMTNLETSTRGFAFVDDTDLCVSGMVMAEQTVTHMQQLVTNWEGFLHTTGGALVPEKCFWYLIDQKWSDGQWHYQSTVHTPASLHVCDSQGRLNTIPCLEVT